MFDEVGLAEALEWQGLSQEKQQRLRSGGRELGGSRASVCKTFELKDRFASMLTHLRRGYEKLKMREELRNFDAIWKA